MSKSLDFFEVWILQMMNNIKHSAEEIVLTELVYSL